MCGFAGYVGRIEEPWLQAARRMLLHRGPDDSGQWVSSDRACGLVHTRLSIIDLSANGHQPMVDQRTGVVIAFNGEIYNFRELRAELELRGHQFVGHSDTEVLLKAIVEYGDAAVERLNGIFAFAAYDPRRGRLLLARDQFGVKPLYFARGPKGIVFASELKALLCEPSVSRELDPAAIGAYVTFLWSPGERTPLKHVKKLLPGHMMICDANGSTQRQYFKNRILSAAGSKGGAALRDELDESLRTAVRRQVVSDVPIGAFLSGGLDSSAVVAYSAQIVGPENLQCFTIASRGEQLRQESVADDLPFARLAARRLGVPLNVVHVEGDMIDRLSEVLFHLDEPQADPAALNVLLIAEMARAHGIKVLLSGTAGDDLFSGYRRHQALRAEALWSWLPRQVRGVVRSSTRKLAGSSARLRKLARAFDYADLADDDRLLSYFYWLAPRASAELLSGTFRATSDAITAPMRDALLTTAAGEARLNRMLALEQQFFLPDHNLNYTDKLAMARGVEVRVPFLDLDLAAFANRLPPGEKMRGLETKWILKKTLERHLPRELVYRPKTGFGAPLRHWLRNELKAWVDELTSPSVLRARGIFDPQAVRGLVASDRSGSVDASYSIFAIICVELWCRMFIDPAVPSRLS